jgi:hypothetical protein
VRLDTSWVRTPSQLGISLLLIVPYNIPRALLGTNLFQSWLKYGLKFETSILNPNWFFNFLIQNYLFYFSFIKWKKDMLSFLSKEKSMLKRNNSILHSKMWSLLCCSKGCRCSVYIFPHLQWSTCLIVWYSDSCTTTTTTTLTFHHHYQGKLNIVPGRITTFGPGENLGRF